MSQWSHDIGRTFCYAVLVQVSSTVYEMAKVKLQGLVYTASKISFSITLGQTSFWLDDLEHLDGWFRVRKKSTCPPTQHIRRWNRSSLASSTHTTTARCGAARRYWVPLHHVYGQYIRPTSQLFLSISIQSHQIHHSCFLRDTSIKPEQSFNQPRRTYQNLQNEGLYHLCRRCPPRGLCPSCSSSSYRGRTGQVRRRRPRCLLLCFISSRRNHGQN